MDDAMFRFRLQNALTNSTYDLQCAVTNVVKRTEIAPDLWHVSFIINEHIMIRALAYDLGGEFDLFFTLSSVRHLLLDPMTEGVKQAMKDYHSIGHGW